VVSNGLRTIMKSLNSFFRITKLSKFHRCIGLGRTGPNLLLCSLTLGGLMIGLLSPTPAVAQKVSLIGLTNNIWRYHPNTVNPNYDSADDWTKKAFDDSSWPQGLGVFGYESSIGIYPPAFHTYIVPPNGVAAGSPIFPGDPTSPLSPGPTGAGTGGPSAYFRTHFNWSSATTAGVNFRFTNYVDDAVIVYLNGVELWSFNMPITRPMTWDVNTLPGGANPGGEPLIFATNATPTSLVTGDNVLAVELHQQGTGSSDDVFDLSLVAIIPFAPVILDSTQPSNRVVLQHRSTKLYVTADGSDPLSFQWFKDNAMIPNATNSSYIIPDMGAGDAGSYYVHISNPVGNINSRTAVVTYTTDTIPPQLSRAVGSATFDKVIVEFNELMDQLST